MQLEELLETIHNSLVLLQDILSKEQAELSALQINPAFLHRLTEKKNEQLASLKHYDTQRLRLEKELSISPPYSQSSSLNAAWNKIYVITKELSRDNRRNGMLLDAHLKNTQDALAFFEKKKRQDIYGPDGQTRTGDKLGRKFSV
ncbi:flagella synthesis protein FlgN [Musicola paradisiaca]|uniref:FlgN family protein n=1 Tax=Musicola paradisiaca (strain Ech703) TaxID=579405 RepID=C6C357_MUSP7|nr:flagellar export chaperone FlgN [Musicola paradisiaca]ACS85322.1 FlgN family protein [Musicola paradisiaca Ech703]